MAAKNNPSEHEKEGETDLHEGADDPDGEVGDEAVVEPEVQAEPQAHPMLPIHPMLHCPICSIRMKYDRCDPCGHTACLQCINNLTQSFSFVRQFQHRLGMKKVPVPNC